MDDHISLLSKLPIKTHPAHCLVECLSEVSVIADKVTLNLRPPFWRRLLGGVSKDHARSITAICNADMTAIIRVIIRIQQQGIVFSSSVDEVERHRGSAISGYAQRAIQICLNWSAAASNFEANIFGSDKVLLEHCTRLTKMYSAIEKPVGSLSEKNR